MFGPDRLPKIMRQVGQALRTFQAESQRAMSELKEAVDSSEIDADLRKAITGEPEAPRTPTPAEAHAISDASDVTPAKTRAPAKKKPAAKKKATAAKGKAAAAPAKKKTAAAPAKKKAAATVAVAAVPAASTEYPATEDT